MQWGPNLCRLCGEIQDRCHLIFDKQPDLHGKIKKCLKIDVFQDDFKPKQVCEPCLHKLDAFTSFYDASQAADAKFESILLNNRTEWDNGAILDYTQQKMSVIVSAKSTIEPLDCSDIDLYKESVLPLENCINEREMLEIVENTYTNLPVEDYLTPPYKKYDFYQESTVLRHSSTYQPEPQPETAINYSCQPAEAPPPAAPIYETFQNVPTMDYANYPPYEPPAKSAPKKPASEKVFACPHCERKFKRRVTLNSHIAIHTKIRPYVCEVCRKNFASKSDLTNHQKVHTDRNKCKYCSSTFPAPSKLQRHLRTHTKDKPFKCDFKNCNRCFADKRNLTTHKLLHTDIFNFACKQCAKVFRTKNTLKQHERSHDERGAGASFRCDVCAKAYKYKSTLIFHMKKHNGYICSFCEEDCGKPVKLIKHKKVCPRKPKL